MKKILFVVFAGLALISIITINGCKKDDTTPPVITLNGSGSVNSILNAAYSDAGATANDDEDGAVAVTSNVSSANPDIDDADTYTITYTATDKAGNQATAVRTVIVYNEAAAAYEGTYHGSETDINGPYTYNPLNDPNKWNIVTASTTVNKQIWMTRLGDFANNTVKMDIVGNTITLPSQTITGVGTGINPCDVHDRTSSGTGVKTTLGFDLTYNDAKVAPCSGSRTNVQAVFIKQ